MKVLYYDCFCGISGDMNLGAMLDLGVKKDYLLGELSKLNLDSEYEIRIGEDNKHGIAGTRVDVVLKNQDSDYAGRGHKGRTLRDIEQIIDSSLLTDRVKKHSLAIFTRLAEAEAKIHNKSLSEVHFHEVGAVDSIVDIVGAAVCLEFLKPDMVLASSVELGGGFVECAHGVLPVPAPATAEILKGIPVKTGKVGFEATTPTGAAILACSVDEFTDKMDFSIESIGYGIGKKDLEIPNVLRVFWGKKNHFTYRNNSDDNIANNAYAKEGKNTDANLHENNDAVYPDKHHEKVLAEKDGTSRQYIIETNIDDMNPELYEYIEEKLFAAGALDVYKTPVIMKKGRPAVKLSVLAHPADADRLQAVIFRETTAIGLRRYEVEKIMLPRDSKIVKTKYGQVAVKYSYLNGKEIKYKPEYEDCKKLAKENGVPLREIYKEIRKVIEDFGWYKQDNLF